MKAATMKLVKKKKNRKDHFTKIPASSIVSYDHKKNPQILTSSWMG